MSSLQSKTITINYDNVRTYITDKDSNVEYRKISGYALAFYGKSLQHAYLNETAKSELFPNSVVHPTRMTFTQVHKSGGLSKAHSFFYIDGTRMFDSSADYNVDTTTTKDFSATDSSPVANCSKNSTLTTSGQHEGVVRVYLKYITITTYFTRYDFSATAGSNVSSASVSSSTGYDGDQITYSCVLADGAVFDGWYDGSTRVSTSQSYTMTVSGADKSLQARATMPVTTKTLSASYNGAQISGFPKSVQSAVSLSYGGTSKGSIPLSGGTKTFSCGGKIANGTININGTNLNNSGKLMATDVVVTVS